MCEHFVLVRTEGQPAKAMTFGDFVDAIGDHVWQGETGEEDE